jgi:hypothetical protein
MVVDISALTPNDSRVKLASFLPTHFVGQRKTGSRIRESAVISHESVSMAPMTKIRVKVLLKSPERVLVKACWAPITSEFNLDMSEPV